MGALLMASTAIIALIPEGLLATASLLLVGVAQEMANNMVLASLCLSMKLFRPSVAGLGQKRRCHSHFRKSQRNPR